LVRRVKVSVGTSSCVPAVKSAPRKTSAVPGPQFTRICASWGGPLPAHFELYHFALAEILPPAVVETFALQTVSAGAPPLVKSLHIRWVQTILDNSANFRKPGLDRCPAQAQSRRLHINKVPRSILFSSAGSCVPSESYSVPFTLTHIASA